MKRKCWGLVKITTNRVLTGGGEKVTLPITTRVRTMSILNGLYGYEVIMLFLGVILFLVLIFILLRSVVKDQPWGKLVPFFLVPIFMIGFPAFKKISYDDGKVE